MLLLLIVSAILHHSTTARWYLYSSGPVLSNRDGPPGRTDKVRLAALHRIEPASEEMVSCLRDATFTHVVSAIPPPHHIHPTPTHPRPQAIQRPPHPKVALTTRWQCFVHTWPDLLIPTGTLLSPSIRPLPAGAMDQRVGGAQEAPPGLQSTHWGLLSKHRMSGVVRLSCLFHICMDVASDRRWGYASQ